MPLSEQNKEDINNRNKLIKNALRPTLIQYLNEQNNKLTTITNLDSAYKVMYDDVNNKINSYNLELSKLDCLIRPSITDEILISAATNVRDKNLNPLFYDKLGNFLAYYKTPFLGTVAVGLTAEPTTDCFINKTSTVYSSINSFINSGPIPSRATGQSCVGNILSNNNTVINSLASLKTNVTQYKTFITNLSSLIYISSGNILRDDQSLNAVNQLKTTYSIITTWEAKSDFAPLPVNTLCSIFNATVFSDTKANTSNLSFLTAGLNDQLIYNSSRLSQLTSYLGTSETITQDPKWGTLPNLSSSEYDLLYYERAILINARVGVTNGSLRQKYSIIQDIEEKEQVLYTLYTSLSVSNYITD